MANLWCTASGTGVSGTIIPKTGTVKFTFTTTYEQVITVPTIYPIDSSGNLLSYADNSQEAGGSWSSTDSDTIYIGTNVTVARDSVTVNTATFVSYYSDYSNLAGLRMDLGWFYIDDSNEDTAEAAFDFYFPSYGNCTPPSNLTLSASQTTGTATLSWTAGGNGMNNIVTGYVITYQESSNGSSWGEINYLTEVSGTSLTVSAPSTVGYYRRFGVQTKGSAGDDYLSDVVWSGSLQKIEEVIYTACSAPTTFTCEPTETDEDVLMTVIGAAGGVNNDLTGYKAQYCESTDGATWGSWRNLWTYETTETDKLFATTLTCAYGTYTKFRICAMGSAGEEYYSPYVESNVVLRVDPDAGGTDPDEPLPEWSETIVAGETAVKAAHITEMQTAANILRARAGLENATFTAAVAGTTSLALWSTQIAEIRAAIDEISTTHDAWITISVNQPTAAVVNQIRDVIGIIDEQ